MSASSPPGDRLVHLIDSLVAGFDALLSSVQAQRESEKALRQRLDFAANEYEKFLAAEGSDSNSSLSATQVVKQLRESLPISEDPEATKAIKKAKLQIRIYKMANPRAQTSGARCPVTHATVDPEDLERDFTTPGKQGSLGCPFARMAANGQPQTPTSIEDPIAAEFHQDVASARSPVTEQRPGQCPIRFLDQHSPEEVAQYFENHKHEIPRSHEICVRRYQGDEHSVRQLDAKYGSLVNMIQGLGVKHKAYLPEKDRIEDQESGSNQMVEKWAENIDTEPTPVTKDAEAQDDEPRLSHFDKPLREIRVGESPTRPWGISVPLDKEPSPSALQSENGIQQPKTKPTTTLPQGAPKKCPVDHGQAKPFPETARNDGNSTKEPEKAHTQIVFNGPVFFGYSAEQVAMLLQSTNFGNSKPASG